MMIDILRQLNRRFVYDRETHGKAFDNWRILKKPQGVLRGDCEDYSLTLAWMLSGRSMWRFWWNILIFKHTLWHVKTANGGHALLYVRGHGWIDNINRHFTEKRPPHVTNFGYPYIPPLVAIKMLLAKIGYPYIPPLVAIKMLLAKIGRTFK